MVRIDASKLTHSWQGKKRSEAYRVQLGWQPTSLLSIAMKLHSREVYPACSRTRVEREVVVRVTLGQL